MWNAEKNKRVMLLVVIYHTLTIKKNSFTKKLNKVLVIEDDALVRYSDY